MSDITLTSSVRQNLLSLQSTADLLSRTQGRLATGNKVNSALDNPTNFFTAASLEARSNDINNLLDGISNGVQIIQAANTGITSLQKLVDSAKSIANQALQTPAGYEKSSASVTIAGATANNLMGTPDTAASVKGDVVTGMTGTTALSALTSAISASDTLTVNGKTISFSSAAGATSLSSKDASGNVTINLSYNDGAAKTASVDDLLAVVKTAIGGSGDAVVGTNNIELTGADETSSLVIGGSAAAKLGLTAGTTKATSSFDGQNLTIAATEGGKALDITLGKNGVNTLDDLNKVLATNNMQASIDKAGKLTFTTTNDNASQNIGAFGGSATTASTGIFAGLTAENAVADANSQNTRASLVDQYNQVINQIVTTAQDASYNGVNLLNGDTLKLVFNETGKSSISISGVSFGPEGLGLSALAKGTDFVDNTSTNKIIDSLNVASTTLRSQASAFGSNLSVVQIRQDFSKSLINVLQTGASNLTLADSNEEAANSQALSTRQSIAVSALALANQSQQGILQLLR